MEFRKFDGNGRITCCVLHILVLVSTIVMQGCENAAVPHDATRARYVLDILPSTRWIYQDEALPVRVEFVCWDADGSTRMDFAEGQHSIEYKLQSETSMPIVLKRQSSNAFGWGWSGDLDLVHASGHAPASGQYKLSITMRLPSGKTIDGGYIRDVDVRVREIELSLRSDKSSYVVGQPISLTGIIKNVSDTDIMFGELQNPGILLKNIGAGHAFNLTLDAITDQWTLKPGSERELFQVQFKAGEADKRFSEDRMRGFVLPPFMHVGRYTLECTMRVQTLQNVPKVREGYVRPWIETLPSSITFEIVRAPQEKTST